MFPSRAQGQRVASENFYYVLNKYIGQRTRQDQQSRTKVAETLELDNVCPVPQSMLENVAFVFLRQKGKNHLIINIVSGGGENLLRVPSFFV